jgi:hypothetical protein
MRETCFGVTSRPLVVRSREYRHNSKDSLLEKPKFVQYARESHRVGWKEARISEMVPQMAGRKIFFTTRKPTNYSYTLSFMDWVPSLDLLHSFPTSFSTIISGPYMLYHNSYSTRTFSFNLQLRNSVLRFLYSCSYSNVGIIELYHLSLF